MKKTLLCYWHYAKGIRKYAILTIVLYALGYLTNVVLRPLVLKLLIDGLVDRSNDISYLIWVFVGVFILKEFFFRSGDHTIVIFESKHMLKLRRASIDNMLKHSMSFFSKNFSGSLIARTRRFITSGEKLFDDIAMQYLAISIQTSGILVVGFLLSKYLFYVFVFWIVICIGVVVLNFKKRMTYDEKEAAMDSKVTAQFSDIISNISVVKRFGGEDREKKDFMTIAQKHNTVLLQSWKFSNRQNIIQASCTQGLHFSSFALSIWLWKQGQFSAGSVMLVMAYSATLSDSVWMLARSLRSFSKNLADAKEMVEVIAEPAEIVDAIGSTDMVRSSPPGVSVFFDRVTFGYPKRNLLFDDFELSIPAGQKIGIVGATGSGKSTFTNLLLRNIEPTSGKIFVDDYDIVRDLTQTGVKKLISSVAQNVDMFHRTIRENIGYGKPNASEEQIISAAKKARIHDFILTLPYGYDTRVGEHGLHLSGGQRQRIAIAQALLHNSPVLILDEATSSLDNITEKEIQQIIRNEMGGKTVIIIAHRLTPVRDCDRIIVFENGRIIQDGSHEELVANTTGFYSKMLQTV